MERDFSSNILSEKASLFCASAMSQCKVERLARNVPLTRVGCITLLMDEVVLLSKGWINERIPLQATVTRFVTTADMYRYLSVFSHLTGLSFGMELTTLAELGCTPPVLERVWFISTNILAYSATQRGDNGERTWNAQRDQTQLLSPFEAAGFRMT